MGLLNGLEGLLVCRRGVSKGLVIRRMLVLVLDLSDEGCGWRELRF